MAQRKNHEVDGWLAKPDSAVAIVLVYGPDRGLVSERARRFALSTGIALDDAFSVVRIDAGDLDADPGRLFDEVGTVSMFAARRLVWIRNAGAQKALADAVKALAKDPPRDAIILIEAGDLKKTAPLRTAAEGGFAAMALPCYSDDARALDGLMEEVLKAQDLRIAPAARRLLKELLGGDRLASRGEIEKLALYCQGKGEIAEEDVRLLIGDVSATSADDALNAALSGDMSGLRGAIARFTGAGGNLSTLLISALRQMQAIRALRHEMERSGRGATAVVATARPPLYFERKSAVERALGRLTAEQVSVLLERLQATMLESRRLPDLADSLIERCLIVLAGTGRRR